MMNRPRHENLTGKRFGCLTVLGEGPRPVGVNKVGAYYRVRCDCGNVKIVTQNNLVQKPHVSCNAKGCRARQIENSHKSHAIMDALESHTDEEQTGTVNGNSETIQDQPKRKHWLRHLRFRSRLAESEDEARHIDPDDTSKPLPDVDNGFFADWCLPRFVKVEYLGVARDGLEKGVVVASFNAG